MTVFACRDHLRIREHRKRSLRELSWMLGVDYDPYAFTGTPLNGGMFYAIGGVFLPPDESKDCDIVDSAIFF